MPWPATDSARTQTAMCVPGSQAATPWLGAAAVTSPDSGSGMFASREKTIPEAAPIFVPGVADVLIV
jgi:hypothetical protein